MVSEKNINRLKLILGRYILPLKTEEIYSPDLSFVLIIRSKQDEKKIRVQISEPFIFN